ncbi:helix-hairpin-helix domain-containing protein [Cellulomonas sp. SG140]|uniref:helix-hairpin-helix domain-containing protein n=1 Tax=Cellulomonas sp. SG140 TaxID=2976536 RepID=UPI0021E852A7|nr:helix-hairpin-helix domain-containing protein [Cellulomonas sp. SG140]
MADEPLAAPVSPPTLGAGGWVPTAVRAAALDYQDSYGVATDLGVGDEPPQRVRWSVPWRLAASAATTVALVVGATLIRASALAPGDPVELPTPAPATVSSSTTGLATPASPSSTDAAQLVIHVVGAVARPGVVRLRPGARVQDAIEAAGGAAGDANLAAVNLARPVTDGEQLVVPGPGQAAQPSAEPSPSSAGARLDLNTATLADLDALPGIGPVLAQRILDRRLQHRFASVDELGEVSGIGPTLLERLRPMVRV